MVFPQPKPFPLVNMIYVHCLDNIAGDKPEVYKV
uniref:Transthyretin-like family protein n=1 Tax=Schistosoma curassoni TaxID=6186 RepID=A0A183JC48_9TREM